MSLVVRRRSWRVGVLIGVSAQLKVEHYEVASYRGLLTAARQMGQNEVTGMLLQNLQQEEQTALLVEQSTPMLLQKAM